MCNQLHNKASPRVLAAIGTTTWKRLARCPSCSRLSTRLHLSAACLCPHRTPPPWRGRGGCLLLSLVSPVPGRGPAHTGAHSILVDCANMTVTSWTFCFPFWNDFGMNMAKITTQVSLLGIWSFERCWYPKGRVNGGMHRGLHSMAPNHCPEVEVAGGGEGLGARLSATLNVCRWSRGLWRL